MQQEKLVVVGSGFVGSTTAYTAMLGGLFSEIVIVDIDRNKAEGDALDMMHGVSFVGPVKVYAGDYSDCKDADIIAITAGVGQRPGETRHDLLKRNADVFENIVGEITKYCKKSVILLVVTNPVDVLTYITAKISGLPEKQVIGSGTVLDTSRLKYMLSRDTGIDARNIHSYVLGEHGDSEMIAWSTVTIAGMSIDEFCAKCGRCTGGQNREKIALDVKNAAYDIINKKGATYYAVALGVNRIFEALVNNENSILTVSSILSGQYGINDVALSLPAIINSGGAQGLIEVPLNDNETRELQKSAQTLKELIRDIGY